MASYHTIRCYLKKITLFNNCCLTFQRNLRSPVRRQPPSPSKKTAQITKHGDKQEQFEEHEEKVDFKKFSKSLSTVTKLALTSDPCLITKLNPQIKADSKTGELYIKTYKLTSTTSRIVQKLDTLTRDTEQQIDYQKLDMEELEVEDPNVPVSSVSCSGCGSKLQCQKKNTEGFMPAHKFKEYSKTELNYKLCQRCDYLRTNKKICNLEAMSFDYDKLVMDRLCETESGKKKHVLLLVDLLDIPNSIYAGWSRLVGVDNLDIVIVGNKFDLLPKTGPGFISGVMECLIKNCDQKGIRGDQIKSVELISAKNGYNIEKLISSLFRIWNDEGDVFLLGATNAGKSVLFNRLLASDYCRSIASTAISRASTSFWPCTTLNFLNFPITFLDSKKASKRTARLLEDRKILEEIDQARFENYEKKHDLKDAELLGMVGRTFSSKSVAINEMDTELDVTYTLDPESGLIREGENFIKTSQLDEKIVQDARDLYRPEYFKNKAAFFYDTPGVIDTHDILRYFSKQELQIVTPAGILMPRVFWMQPGQSLFVSGLIRVDLLESTNNERVLFTIMASPAMPVVNPFPTLEADEKYREYYEKGTVLRVPHRQHEREKPLPEMVGKNFVIDCIGNHKSMTDIVFSSYGWISVTSLPDVTAKIKAYTLGGIGLKLREPSLLPFVVNMRSQWFRKDGSQAFKSKYYKKPKNL